jgi:hypothetical protein
MSAGNLRMNAIFDRWIAAVLCVAVMSSGTQAEDGFSPHRLGNLDHGSGGDQAFEVHQSRPSLLREGTSLPPTAGRILLVGRRWIFIPQGTADSKGAEKKGDKTKGDHMSGDDDDSNVLMHRKISREVQIVPVGTKLTTSNSSDKDSSEGLLTSEGPQWQLVENLMLQRIANAIRSDSVDDAWILTGRVTEFFDENYLIIESARRSNR